MPFNRTANVDPAALADGVTPELVRYAFGRLGREISDERVAAVVDLVAELGGFDAATRWAYSHCTEQRGLDVRAVWAGLYDGLHLRIETLRRAAAVNADPALRARLAVIEALLAGSLAVAA